MVIKNNYFNLIFLNNKIFFLGILVGTPEYNEILDILKADNCREIKKYLELI
jgi:hypothetical protein